MLNPLTHLENLLHTTSHIIVLVPHDVGVHNAGCGVQRVHSRVDAQLCDGTGQHGCGIQVGKGGGRRGVSQVISRHVDRLGNRGRYMAEGGRPPQDRCQPEPGQEPITCTEVMEPLRVVVILSCMVPMSVARVGW